MISIKESTIHGRGVFAAQDIPNDTFLTMYPSDYNIKNSQVESIKGTKYEPYLLSIDENTNIYGEPDSDDLTKCGHIVNDGYKPKVPKNFTNTEWVECAIDYYVHSTRKMNVKLDEKITSNKAIRQGSEILTTYGYPYWVVQITDKPCPLIAQVVSHMLNQKVILDFIREFNDLDLLKHFLMSFISDKIYCISESMNPDKDQDPIHAI